MIVCLDTNVFVSGIYWKGTPSRILDLWIGDKIRVVVSPDILSEYEIVLKSFEKKMAWDVLSTWMDFAKSQSVLVTPAAWPEISCRDPSDKKFLTCALEGHADFLITGDQDLLEMRKLLWPFEIIRPAAFLKK